MLILHSPQILHQKVAQWKADSRICLVPTMGCLHSAHRALVERAKQEEARVIVSIFVNPLQFSPNEDFERYPRPFEDDVRLLEEAGVDCLFAPRTVDLYPEGFSTSVSVKKISEHLCGKSRPGHFDGVATVCLKLFQITQADSAVFGEKDFQQLRILERMVEDLNLSVRIIPHKTVRESDGLALSSRNRYLSNEERQVASRINDGLSRARKIAIDDPLATVGNVLAPVLQQLAPPFAVEYASVASSEDLVPLLPDVRILDVRLPRLFVAAKLGNTRLIDNVALHRSEGM